MIATETQHAGGGRAEAAVNKCTAAVDALPGADPAQRAEVMRLSAEVLGELKRCDGIDLSALRAVAGSIGPKRVSLKAVEAVAQAHSGLSPQWCEAVGIAQTETRSEEWERRHFEAVEELEAQIRCCCQAVDDVQDTIDIGVDQSLGAALQQLEIACRYSVFDLCQLAVQAVIQGLECAKAMVRDGVSTIEQCFDGLAESVGEVADHTPPAAVEYCPPRKAPPSPCPPPVPEAVPAPVPKPAAVPEPAPAPAPAPIERLVTCCDTASTQPAATGEGSREVEFDYDLDPRSLAREVPVQAAGCETKAMFQPAAAVPPVAEQPPLGPLLKAGATAVLGGLECLSQALETLVECPGSGCCTCNPEPGSVPEPAPAPEPAQEPAAAPEPPPAPGPQVAPPPPELAAVEEPAPPPKKQGYVEMTAASQHVSLDAAEETGDTMTNNLDADASAKRAGEW